MIILEELQLKITNWKNYSKKQVGDGLSQLGAGRFHSPDHGSFRVCSSMVQVGILTFLPFKYSDGFLSTELSAGL